MGECSCILMDFDGHATFQTIVIRKARKSHICQECQREIEPGEKYEYTSGLWEGTFFQQKTCLDCLSVRDSFFCSGWWYEEIWRDLQMHLESVDGVVESACILSLTPKAKERVLDIIDDIWSFQDRMKGI